MPRFSGVKPSSRTRNSSGIQVRNSSAYASGGCMHSPKIGLRLRTRLFLGSGIRTVAVQTMLADIILNARRHKPVYRSAARKPLPQLG